MFKKFLPCLFALSSLFGVQTQFPSMIDCSHINYLHSDVGDPALFNNAPEIGAFIMHLKRHYAIETAVETGTYNGETTAFFALHFDHVHSIDLSQEYCLRAQDRFTHYPNVKIYQGSSEKVLAKILPGMKNQRVLFYLNAHWGEKGPLFDELEEIGKTHQNNCVIIIDDFKVPGRTEFAYDVYNGKECSFEYIKETLDKFFHDYTYHYILPKHTGSRAKFLAIPKNWQR